MKIKRFRSFVKTFVDNTTDGNGRQVKLLVKYNAMYFPREAGNVNK